MIGKKNLRKKFFVKSSKLHGECFTISAADSVCVHAGTRHPRIEGATASGTCQARRQDHLSRTPLTGKSPPNCEPNCQPNCQPNCLPN